MTGNFHITQQGIPRVIHRLLATVLFLIAAVGGSQAYAQAPQDLPRIAHAGGQVGEATYTNSLEALDENYGAGFRAFEIDFSFTADRELVCLHDWEESFTRSFGLPPSAPVPLEEFKRLVSENSAYTKCTLSSLMQWFDSHPDALLVTDVKEDNVEALEHISRIYPQYLPRIIPQIYQPEEYAAVKDLGYEKLIWTLYLYPGGTQSVLNALPDMSLWAVTMNTDRSQEQLPRLLAEQGMSSYAHTINQYADLLYLKSLGIDEIYTDGLSPTRESELAKEGRITERDSALLKAREQRQNDKVLRIDRFFSLPRVHYNLERNFDPSGITTNQISDLKLLAGTLQVVATGNDPYINFPVLDEPAEEIEIYLDIAVPDDTMVEVFYTTAREPDFSASRRVSQRVTAGENQVVIAIDESSPVSRFRLDPGTVSGDYRIGNIEIRSDSGSFFRSLFRFQRRN